MAITQQQIERYKYYGVNVALLNPNPQYRAYRAGSKCIVKIDKLKNRKGERQMFTVGGAAYHQSFKTADLLNVVAFENDSDRELVTELLK